MDPQYHHQVPLPDLDLLLVEGGIFSMGDNTSDSSREKPEHRVEVPSFYMARYPVTQQLWQAAMENNPFYFKGDSRPVEQVSWNDAQDFIQKLNKESGKNFRLATEAEWEYAARGGQYSQGYTYAGSDKLRQVGWYDENSNNKTHEVGLLLANELGLYDMSGNVYEWCEDDFHDTYNRAPDDGSAWVEAPDRGVNRVLRGGSYFDEAVYCRSVDRFRYLPVNRGNIGFRLVFPLQFTR